MKLGRQRKGDGRVVLHSVLNVKAVVAAFNQEKALPSRGLLRDYEPSDGPSFKALLSSIPVLSLSSLESHLELLS